MKLTMTLAGAGVGLVLAAYGNYATLKSENMTMPGTVRSVQRPPSVVVCCG